MKRFSMIFFSLLLVIGCCNSLVNAASFESTRASDYITNYEATLFTGGSKEELDLEFDITSTKNTTSIGISQIKLYKADGTYVKSISGSISNGLLARSGYWHSGSYTLSAAAGREYYVQVTFVARDSKGGDSRSYTTNIAMAAS